MLYPYFLFNLFSNLLRIIFFSSFNINWMKREKKIVDPQIDENKKRKSGQPKVVILSFLSCGSTDAILGWARICWTSPRKRKKRTTSWPDNCLYNPVGPNTFSHYLLLLYVLGHRIMNLLLVFSFHTAYKRKRKRMCDHMFERFLSFF